MKMASATAGKDAVAHRRAQLSKCFAQFEQAWPRALKVFSPYTRLQSPILCLDREAEKEAGLQSSFAMIRMRDERIVIGLPQVLDHGVEDHAYAILAHEVGHYVHAPGSLREHVRLHDRIRRCLLPEQESYAGLTANLYTDLLLNDRLQRGCDVDIAAVYKALRPSGEVSALWSLYMRIYERLWKLPRNTLTSPNESVELDADLGARLVRLFRTQWLEGAGSFAKLISPYLDDSQPAPAWLDTAATDIGETIPDGLIRDDFDPEKVRHPALDDRIAHSGEADAAQGDEATDGAAEGKAAGGDGRADVRDVQRGPAHYVKLLQSLGAQLSAAELVARYYRELAAEHLIPFPTQPSPQAVEPQMEGLEVWHAGGVLSQIDWMQTLLRSGTVIAGVTTMQRRYGSSPGGEPKRHAPDLYVGIDCSGSMANPATQLAHPVLAGVVVALSALRVGARVMACLSGEWTGHGSHVETAGFVRDETKLLGVLTDYLGTGASFGISRLQHTFVSQPPRRRPAHILLVSDSDLFSEIDTTHDGWEIVRCAVERAGGGATAVLRLADQSHYQKWIERLGKVGVEVYRVSSEEQLVAFARAFARRTFSAEIPKPQSR